MLGFIDDKEIISLFRIVINSLPKGARASLVGGTMRNALFYFYHRILLPQRDFDIALTHGNLQLFKNNLVRGGFEVGRMDTAEHFTVRKKIQSTSHIDNAWVYIDVSKSTQFSTRNFNQTDFTVGCSSIPLRKVLNENWKDWVRSLPQGLRDIKAKQLHLHKVGTRSVFRLVRFVYMGFLPPSARELKTIVSAYDFNEGDILLRNKEKLEKLVPKKDIKFICKKLGVPLELVVLSH